MDRMFDHVERSCRMLRDFQLVELADSMEKAFIPLHDHSMRLHGKLIEAVGRRDRVGGEAIAKQFEAVLSEICDLATTVSATVAAEQKRRA